MTVVRNGSFEISPNHELHSNHLFRGRENKIYISRVYSADFECKFEMQYYPFDVQQCSMNFILEVEFTKPLICYYCYNVFYQGNLWERCRLGEGYG